MDGFEKLNNSIGKHPSDRIYLKEYLRLLEEYINKDINKRFFIFEQIKTLEMKPLLYFLLLFMFPFSLISQINPNGIPISFNGNGWKLIGDNFGTSVLGHETIPGAILIIEHGFSDIQPLKSQLESGYQEDGFELYPNGTAQNNDNMLSISLNGYVDGSAVKSEALGLLTNNKSCKGFILLSLTDEYSDNSTHKSHMVNIAKSIRIKPLSNDPSWSQKLNGQELIYRDSYSTNSSSSDGSFYVGASSSSTEKYAFCNDGSFYYSNSSYTSASGSGLDAQTNNANDSDGGTWNVLNMGGSVVIKLIYTDGTVIYSPISRDNGYYYFGEQKYTKGPSSYCN